MEAIAVLKNIKAMDDKDIPPLFPYVEVLIAILNCENMYSELDIYTFDVLDKLNKTEAGKREFSQNFLKTPRSSQSQTGTLVFRTFSEIPQC